MKKNIFKFAVVALVAVLAAYLFYSLRSVNNNRENKNSTTTPDNSEQVFCTMEAKLCPDGSYVGRTGPKCEFAPCSNSWQESLDPQTGIYFNYPERLPAKYISVVNWPPRLQLLEQPFTCKEGGSPISSDGQTAKIKIEDTYYCITKKAEGAAGSIYTQYTYAFAVESQTGVLTFSVREVQCGNYDGAEKLECENERVTFDLNGLVDRMVKSAGTTE